MFEVVFGILYQICSMTIFCIILLVIFVVASASDPGARNSRRDHAAVSRTSDRSRSREVDSYLRSMSKIKPNWSEEKILRSARTIYGADSVPRSVPQYQPGTAPARVGSVTHSVVEGMSSDKKRQEILRISHQNPTWKGKDILEQFKRDFPLEPNPPDIVSMNRYLFFLSIDERVAANIPEGQNWNHLPPATKAQLTEIGRGVMKEKYLANPEERWDEHVYATIAEIRQVLGIRLAPSSVYKWYNDVRKEALGMGTKRGPKKRTHVSTTD